MSDSEFLDLVDQALERVENALEESDADVDVARSGNVLSVEFADGGKIIINSQVAMHELWVAARAGGFHFRHDGSVWRDTRERSELFQVLSRLVSEQAGEVIALRS